MEVNPEHKICAKCFDKNFGAIFSTKRLAGPFASRSLPHGNADSASQHNERVFCKDNQDSTNVQHGSYRVL